MKKGQGRMKELGRGAGQGGIWRTPFAFKWKVFKVRNNESVVAEQTTFLSDSWLRWEGGIIIHMHVSNWILSSIKSSLQINYSLSSAKQKCLTVWTNYRKGFLLLLLLCFFSGVVNNSTVTMQWTEITWTENEPRECLNVLHVCLIFISHSLVLLLPNTTSFFFV